MLEKGLVISLCTLFSFRRRLVAVTMIIAAALTLCEHTWQGRSAKRRPWRAALAPTNEILPKATTMRVSLLDFERKPWYDAGIWHIADFSTSMTQKFSNPSVCSLVEGRQARLAALPQMIYKFGAWAPLLIPTIHYFSLHPRPDTRVEGFEPFFILCKILSLSLLIFHETRDRYSRTLPRWARSKIVFRLIPLL